jgi:hypothetical protein
MRSNGYKSLRDELTYEGQKALNQRYARAYKNQWTISNDEIRSLLVYYPSYRMGYLDWCADNEQPPMLYDQG